MILLKQPYFYPQPMSKRKPKSIADISALTLKILTEDERTRDDDQLLCAMIWSRLAIKQGHDVRKETAYNFLLLYVENKLVSADTITRARRKIQEERPSLRGKKYVERQKKQAQVINELRTLK